MAGAGFCAFLLSTPAFLQACLAVLRSVYMYLVNPILMLAVYAMVGIVAALIWLFSWIQLGFQPPEESVMMDLQGIAETLEIETAGNAPGYLEKIGIALAALGFTLTS